MLRDATMGAYILVTKKESSQLVIVAILEAGPRARRGNISDMTSHGTGPQANAKKRLNKTKHIMDSHLIFDASTEWLIEPTRDTASDEEVSFFGGI